MTIVPFNPLSSKNESLKDGVRVFVASYIFIIHIYFHHIKNTIRESEMKVVAPHYTLLRDWLHTDQISEKFQMGGGRLGAFSIQKFMLQILDI